VAFDPEHAFQSPVFESFESDFVKEDELDVLLANGWRHFGKEFFRTSHAVHENRICGVLALRLDASRFAPTSGLRRTVRKNSATRTIVVPARHQPAYDALFHRHKKRFRDPVPDSLRDFLSEEPAGVPCMTLAFELHIEDRLAAVSFLALGRNSVSAVYAMFDPDFAKLRPGMFTIAQEIQFAVTSGRQWYYPGYAYSVPSPYDYKLSLPNLEAFDWRTTWEPLIGAPSWSRPLPPHPEAKPS
jgi:arginine-tRNA-protein transferase